MKTRLLTLTIAALALPTAPVPMLAAAEPPEKPAPAAALNDLEQQFAESMSGVVLRGYFTVDGRENKGALKEEKYTIAQVGKVKDDIWLFHCRIQYGEHDVTIPLPLSVRWAGDTPLIMLTDQAIPGLGTYTARVVVYRGRYSGTWSGKDHGGHLFGRVEKLDEQPPAGN